MISIIAHQLMNKSNNGFIEKTPDYHIKFLFKVYEG